MITVDFKEVFDDKEMRYGVEPNTPRRLRKDFKNSETLNMLNLGECDLEEEEEYKDQGFKKPAFNVSRPWNTFITIDQVTKK